MAVGGIGVGDGVPGAGVPAGALGADGGVLVAAGVRVAVTGGASGVRVAAEEGIAVTATLVGVARDEELEQAASMRAATIESPRMTVRRL
jgi:hypothetical protein